MSQECLALRELQYGVIWVTHRFREPHVAASSSGEQGPGIVRHISGEFLKSLPGHVVECGGVRRPQHNGGSCSGLVGLQPPSGADGPSISRLQSGESVLGQGGAEVVADGLLMLEELRRHDGTHGVGAEIIGARRRVAISIEAGQRLHPAHVELAAEHIALVVARDSCHGSRVERWTNLCISIDLDDCVTYRRIVTDIHETLPRLDPHTDAFYQDPYPAYAELRDKAPVYEIPDQPGLFFVTTWPLVREALMDPARFSNNMPAARRDTPPPEVVDEVEALRAQGYPYRPALGTNDPPDHTRYRKMVNRAFTVRGLAWMEPLVDEVSDQIASTLPDGEVIDAMEQVTVPLPVWAIMRILGLDDKYREDLRRWSDSSNAALGGKLSAERWLEVERDVLEYQQVICEVLDDRRVNPGPDLLTTLVKAENDEVPLTNHELVWLVRELVVAGNETTIRALADMLVRIDEMRATQPDIWDRIRDDEAFRRGLVEEGIRYSSPVMGLWRKVMFDTELGGVAVPEGSTLFLAYGSANRDPEVFEDPDTFDPLRENVKEHLAFGHGIHVCVGAGLARIEASSALRALGENVTALEVLDPSALRFGPSFGLRGLTELPVRVHRRHS